MTRLLPVLLLLLSGCQKPEARVVLYCAQDKEFAEPLFAGFKSEHALDIAPKFDTEANKSVSLAHELEAEAARPRGDVHWNNEILNTIRLARKGVYEPYTPANAAAYPDWTRPADRSWQAFAARARVLIVNTSLVPEGQRPRGILDLTAPKWAGKVAMAKPQFGTTATHAAALFDVLGANAAKTYYRSLKANNVRIVAGNKQVAVGVAEGRFAVGVTDTDDALIELNAGKPVAIVFPDRDGHPDHPRLGVLYIPNTVALVKGGPNPAGGQKLIEYLLRPETEVRLAEGGGFQIPLNPNVKAILPAAVVTPDRAKRMAVDWEKAADLWDEVQTFMRDEFAR
jgi:iron(III) transport system substrate-binding protein